MGNAYKPPSHQHPSESGNDYSYDWERSIFSVTADDFRDLSDGDLADPPDVLTRPSTRLPTVDEFDFEEACAAKDLARRFGPPDANRAAKRRRWSFAGKRSRLDPVRSASPKRRGRGRGLVWGLCTSILIIMISPVLLGIIQPFGDLPLDGTGNQQSNVADGSQAGIAVPTQPSDPEQIATDDVGATERDADVAENNAEPDPLGAVATALDTDRTGSHDFVAEGSIAEGSADIAEDATGPQIIEIPSRPATAGISQAFAAPAVGVLAHGDGSTIAERSDAPEPAFDPVATVLEPRPIELARPLAAAPPVPAPAEDAEPATITADDDRPKPVVVQIDTDSPQRLAQAQQRTDADSPAEEDTAVIPDTSGEPASKLGQPAGSSLTSEQIDQLLERAGELLRRGDIASARLLFLRIADTGDRRGAKGVGMTYDPRVYARLAVTGVTPDQEQAELWYQKAGDDLAFNIDLTPETAQAEASDTSDTEEEGSFDRDAACARKYTSYEPSTGLYTSYSGAKRPCRLP